jgi:hypothetical protein
MVRATSIGSGSIASPKEKARREGKGIRKSADEGQAVNNGTIKATKGVNAAVPGAEASKGTRRAKRL